MLPVVRNLLVLQDRDQRIARLKKELVRIPLEEAQAKARLSGDEAAVAEADEAAKRNEVAIKNLELTIETRRDTIGKLKNQQFETRKNEEYRALGSEVERYAREIAAFEDQQLELMEKGETLKATLASAKKALAATQSFVDDELAGLAQRTAACHDQIAEAEAERQVAASAIGDEGLLGQYDRIFKNKKDAAVVPLAGGNCGGCHMRVTPATLHSARAEAVVTYCENCGRIVYLSE
ncbi:C4-type zinc ribbon domain-containing protein [soil metagenome]